MSSSYLYTKGMRLEHCLNLPVERLFCSMHILWFMFSHLQTVIWYFLRPQARDCADNAKILFSGGWEKKLDGISHWWQTPRWSLPSLPSPSSWGLNIGTGIIWNYRVTRGDLKLLTWHVTKLMRDCNIPSTSSSLPWEFRVCISPLEYTGPYRTDRSLFQVTRCQLVIHILPKIGS